ncbi:hypothetical protein [Salinisphaera aquimarina]|uniref:Uncharacterized protein n=1 Tax=Salinisphaera aquimarina TaxID=2094031 RepID=A0ABV7EMQ0_9GAMM
MRYHHDRADLRGAAVLAFVGGLVLLGIGLPIVHSMVPEPAALGITAAAVAAWLLTWGTYGYRAWAARGREDVIRFDDAGFESQLFGRIAFADVRTHSIGRDARLFYWEVAAPSLTLRLADRRRLRFHLDGRHYRQDLLDYVAFIEAARAGLQGEKQAAQVPTLPGQAALFSETMAEPTPDRPAGPSHSAAEASPSQAEPSPKTTHHVRRNRRAPADEPGTRRERRASAASTMSRANRNADRRFREQMVKHSKWAALAMVLLPLTYGIRACDSGPIKSMIAPNPFESMKEDAPKALERSTSLLQTAVAEQGPVYMWGPAGVDRQFKPILAPNVNARHIGIDMLDTMNTAGSIIDFLVGGEAEGYRMGLQHDDTATLSSYSQISLRPVDGERTLSFFLLPPPEASNTERTGKLPQVHWRIRYRQVDDIPDKLDEFNGQLPMPIITRWLKMTPRPSLVVTASHYQGMTDDAFRAAVDAVKQDFQRRGIDTAEFEIQRFADGTVENAGPDRHPESQARGNTAATGTSNRRHGSDVAQ